MSVNAILIDQETLIAPEFSTSNSYGIGDYVKYGNRIYRFFESKPAGAWNGGYVEEISAVGQYVTAGKSSGTTLGRRATAEGEDTTASGDCSHAEGSGTTAIGTCSHAEGVGHASGDYSHAEGRGTASEDYSHAEGEYTTASGICSHAEGADVTAFGDCSHAEGRQTTAGTEDGRAECSHAEGCNTTASGNASHAEGEDTIASGNSSHAEGGWHDQPTVASGDCSHAEGADTIASAWTSHVEGQYSQANGEWSHAEGYATLANSEYQHVFGRCNVADSTPSGAEHGQYLEIAGNGYRDNDGIDQRSNARTLDWDGNEQLQGNLYVGTDTSTPTLDNTKRVVTKSELDGHYVTAGKKSGTTLGYTATAEGLGTTASGSHAHAEGYYTIASGSYGSHAEGLRALASGQGSHAEGGTSLFGDYIRPSSDNESTTTFLVIQQADIGSAATELTKTMETGSAILRDCSALICGEKVKIIGTGGHYDPYGESTLNITFTPALSSLPGKGEFIPIIIMPAAEGEYSHAEGNATVARGTNSHAEGKATVANSYCQHVFGEYNTWNSNYEYDPDERGEYVEIVGNGTSTTGRSNARTLDWSGNEILAGKLTIGGEDGITLSVDSNGNLKVTKGNKSATITLS